MCTVYVCIHLFTLFVHSLLLMYIVMCCGYCIIIVSVYEGFINVGSSSMNKNITTFSTRRIILAIGFLD